MKYLLQVRFNGAQHQLEALPPHDQDAIAEEYRSLDDATVTANGPLAGTLDGCYLCETPDVSAAIALAARIPAARMGGTVEVRALLER